MDKITDFMNDFSLEKYIPKLDKTMDWVQQLISFAVRVGPICILVLGLIYLLIPPKEANRKAGYRTYFGMGSIMAWRFTQFAAGVLMTLAGLILTLIANGNVGKFEGMDLMTMANTAFGIIKGQVICALVIYVIMFLLTAVMFNRKGDCRFGKKANDALNALFIREKKGKKPVKAAPQPEELPEETLVSEESQTEYEKQGEQVITADDIVIEGLD